MVHCNINNIDITNTRKKLLDLNKLINSKTNNRIRVDFDYIDYYKTYSSEIPLYFDECRYNSRKNILILALKLDNKYVSTISCDIFTTHITISSKTHNSYTNRYFNLLLRTVIILLCNSIKICNKKITKIRSYILNPISENTLIKHFNAIYDKNDKEILEIVCDKNTMDNAYVKLLHILDYNIKI